jgi:SPX domain-containing protein involved in vacuolar polyphosphate accumulation
VAKVNIFYRNIADEIENMLNFLTEQAGPSYNFKKKKQQPLEGMRRKLQRKMHAFSKTGSKLTEENDVDDLDDLDDFELGGLTASERSKTNEKVKEADSIRRALTDLHRRAKLLMNYAMINSTGFIKIIKKFTKHFPENKDEYAEVLEEGFICGGGKRVRGLCSRMEQYYANWFCDGNETEARSFMLPKKGDGLNMDWSQLR